MNLSPLLIVGCVFPIISWISLIIATINQKILGIHCSPAFVPIIGPVLLNSWSIQSGHPVWFLIVPWVLDIGTLWFLFLLPNMIKEYWQYSKFTRIFVFHSKKNHKNIALSIHKNEHFIIKFNWQREKNETGIISMNDFGKYTIADNGDYTLTSHTGTKRKLYPTKGHYVCMDHENKEASNIDGYTFSIHKK